MKKLSFLLFIIILSSACREKNQKIDSDNVAENKEVEKYFKEDAIKAYKDLKFGMDVSEIFELGYISNKDTSKWIFPLKDKNIGNVKFEDADILCMKINYMLSYSLVI